MTLTMQRSPGNVSPLFVSLEAVIIFKRKDDHAVLDGVLLLSIGLIIANPNAA